MKKLLEKWKRNSAANRKALSEGLNEQERKAVLALFMAIVLPLLIGILKAYLK